MSILSSELCAQIQQRCHDYLRSEPAGLSEYELIRRLRSCEPPLLPQCEPGDQLALFRLHFTLFNALYQLRDELWRRQEATLQIHALKVLLLPYLRDEEGLMVTDPLRDYYLDPDHLRTTDRQEVERMVADFWNRIGLLSDECREALALLGFDEPVSWTQIRGRFRQLVMLHHPDRGGDEEQMRRLNAAMKLLEAHYAP